MLELFFFSKHNNTYKTCTLFNIFTLGYIDNHVPLYCILSLLNYDNHVPSKLYILCATNDNFAPSILYTLCATMITTYPLY